MEPEVSRAFLFMLFNKIFFNIFIFHLRIIEKLVKGHFEKANIEFDKLTDPFSPI
jgi:hypothetical protein